MTPEHHKRGVAPRVGGLDPLVVTTATVILVVSTIGILILGFVTSAGALMHLPKAVIIGGDGLAGLFLMWLAWLVGRAAWRSERQLAMGGDPPDAVSTDPR